MMIRSLSLLWISSFISCLSFSQEYLSPVSNSLGGVTAIAQNDHGIWSNPALTPISKTGGVELTSTAYLSFPEVQRHSALLRGSVNEKLYGRALFSSLGFGPYRSNIVAISGGMMIHEKSAVGVQLGAESEHFGEASPALFRLLCGVGFTKQFSDKINFGGVTHFSAGNAGWKNNHLALGISWKISQPIRLIAQISHSTYAKTIFSSGFEYWPAPYLAVRLGWNNLHVPACGISILTEKLRFDLAYRVSALSGSLVQIGIEKTFRK